VIRTARPRANGRGGRSEKDIFRSNRHRGLAISTPEASDGIIIIIIIRISEHSSVFAFPSERFYYLPRAHRNNNDDGNTNNKNNGTARDVFAFRAAPDNAK